MSQDRSPEEGGPEARADLGGAEVELRPSDMSVLETLAPKIGERAGIRLQGTDSDMNAPVIDPRAAASASPTKGRACYQLQGEIARGGMGVVLRGHDSDLGRDVALKVLHKHLAEDPQTLQRFVEEAQIGGQLQHPGIVPVYELGLMSDERPYFTMKLVKGRTLAQLLADRKAPDQDLHRFLAIFRDVCQTTAYAHSRGVIHRDLKPSNVMVGTFGEVQVVDWGLAKVLGGRGGPDRTGAALGGSVVDTVRSGSRSGDTSMDSMAGSVMGTPAYMSPEQARGEVEHLDERTDVFSLGAILCEILTGKPPYSGGERDVVVRAARPDQADCLARLRECGADPALRELAVACLAPEPEGRPRDAAKLAEAVRAHEEAVESRARAAQVRAARAVGFAVSTVLVMVIVVAGYAWFRGQKQARLQRTTTLVDQALEESFSYREASDWAAARAAVNRARAHLQAGERDEALDARVTGAEEAVERSERRVIEEARRAEQRREFLAEVETIREKLGLTNERKLEAYAGAFERMGIALDERPDDEIARTILATELSVEVALALTDWSRLLRDTEGQSTPMVRRLLELALAVDADPERVRLRRALLAEDRVGILAMASRVEEEAYPPMTSIILADALWWTGERESALRVLDVAERRYPDDFHLQAKLAIRYLNLLQPEAALLHLKAAQALKPRSPWVLTYLGLAHRATGDLERAADLLRRAIALDPDNGIEHSHLGVVLAESGELDDAIASFSRAIERNPSYSYAHGHLAAALQKKGLFREAVRSYREAVALAPDSDTLANSLAWLLATAPDPEARDPEEAVRYAERSIALVRDAAGMNTLGVCYYRAGRFRECVEALQKSVRLSADQVAGPVDSFFLAMARQRLDQPELAVQHYRDGVEWMGSNELSPSQREYLPRFRREAAELLGLEEGSGD